VKRLPSQRSVHFQLPSRVKTTLQYCINAGSTGRLADSCVCPHSMLKSVTTAEAERMYQQHPCVNFFKMLARYQQNLQYNVVSHQVERWYQHFSYTMDLLIPVRCWQASVRVAVHTRSLYYYYYYSSSPSPNSAAIAVLPVRLRLGSSGSP
jgi:hypothetical protein